MIIGVAGKARHGKDTIGEHLVSSYGFTRIAFADTVKSVSKRLFDLSQEQCYGKYKEMEDRRYPRVKSKAFRGLAGVAGSQALEFLTAREILQGVGQGMRDIYEDVWTDIAINNAVKLELAVITDVRFPNEVKLIKEKGGMVWKVIRPGHNGTQFDKDISETALDSMPDDVFDAIFVNDGSLRELCCKVDTEWLRLKRSK